MADNAGLAVHVGQNLCMFTVLLVKKVKSQESQESSETHEEIGKSLLQPGNSFFLAVVLRLCCLFCFSLFL
jgi:hypothetical protein